MKKIYKLIEVALITTIIGSTLTACSHNKNGDIKDENKNPKVNIKVMSFGENSEALKIAVDDYAGDTGVNVSIVSEESSDLTLRKNLEANVDIPNVVCLEPENIQYYIKKYEDKLIKFDDFIGTYKNKLNKNYLSTVMGENKSYYGMPYEVSPIMMYYRKDIFELLNIDLNDIRTWDDFIEIGEKIKKLTGNKIKITSMNNNDDYLYRLILSEQGVSYVNNEGKFILNGEESLRAMSILKRLKDSETLYMYEDVKAIESELKNSNIATMISNKDFLRYLKAKFPEQANLWGVRKVPSIEVGGRNAFSMGGSLLIGLKSSEETVDHYAKDFITFAATYKSSLLKASEKFDFLPALNDIYLSKEYDRSFPYLGGQKLFDMLNSISKESMDLFYSNNYLEVQQKMIETQKNIINTKGDSKIELDKLQQWATQNNK